MLEKPQSRSSTDNQMTKIEQAQRAKLLNVSKEFKKKTDQARVPTPPIESAEPFSVMQKGSTELKERREIITMTSESDMDGEHKSGVYMLI